MANKAFRVLSALFNYGHAIYPELAGWSNPVRVLADARVKQAVRPRTTHIPTARLAHWLAALDAYRANTRPQEAERRRDDVWLLLKLMLMTGLRSNEARSLRWTDIDLCKGIATIRQEVAKNRQSAALPLNSWLIHQLSSRHTSATAGYVFEAATDSGYINNLNRPLAEIQKRAGFRITAHDLRRTYATYLDSIGAPFGVIKQLLNHASSGDVTAHYIQKRNVADLRVFADKVLALIDASCDSVHASD